MSKRIWICKHSPEQIMEWAEFYIEKGTNLRETGANFGVPWNSVYWCFKHRLQQIDRYYYERVMEQLDKNRENRGYRRVSNG